jgi:hypothetical protein
MRITLKLKIENKLKAAAALYIYIPKLRNLEVSYFLRSSVWRLKDCRAVGPCVSGFLTSADNIVEVRNSKNTNDDWLSVA